MFTGKLIGFAFVVMIVTNLLLLDAPQDNPKKADKVISFIGMVAALYSLAAGIHLLGGWEDPFRGADPQQFVEISARGRGRGFAVLLIRNWPYALIGFGLLTSFNVIISIAPYVFKRIRR